MRNLIVSLITLLPLSVLAQRVVDVGKDDINIIASGFFYTVGGEPVSTAKYVRVVDGSPFFLPDWTKSIITLSEGKQYGNIQSKLDLVANTVYFLDPEGREMIATTPIKEVMLIDSIRNKVYTFINSTFIDSETPLEAGWYQVLMPGKTPLLKKINKSISESKPYGSATTEQRINSSSSYYVLSNKSLAKVKKFKDLGSLLSDKSSEVDDYISKNKLNGKNEKDYIDVVDYYNSLQKSSEQK